MKATAQKQSALTGEIFYLRPAGFRPQRFFQDGFPPGTTQQSGQSDAKKATGVKATDAADAYEHILTIQNAADLEFPATAQANAPARAEFKLGIFPPDHHVPPAAPTPTPTPQTPKP